MTTQIKQYNERNNNSCARRFPEDKLPRFNVVDNQNFCRVELEIHANQLE
jgi:hypothetical protein